MSALEVTQSTENQMHTTNRNMRQWQERLLQVFELAVLPATKHIHGIVSSGTTEEGIDRELERYYRSIRRPKIHEDEIVWGEEERKIETLLSSKTDHGRCMRAQFQAATGAGKSLVMVEMIRAHLKSDVRADPNTHPVYVVVEPSINLVRQGYEAVSGLAGVECVCVASKDVPAQTKKIEAVQLMKRRHKPIVVFTTKNSAACQENATGLMTLCLKHDVVIDLLLIDESHTVAGEAKGKGQKEIYDKKCSVSMLKITFTATPVASPQQLSNGYHSTSRQKGSSFFCQNDCLGVFGPTMCRYTYGEALRDAVVVPLHLLLMDNSVGNHNDYLTAMLGAWDREVSRMSCADTGDILDASSEKQRPAGIDETVWRAQRMLMILQVLYDLAKGVQTHVLVFCRTIARVGSFCALLEFLCAKCIAENRLGGKRILPQSPEETRLRLLSQNIYYDVSDGKSSSDAEDFKKCEMGILVNVNKISVGFDIPKITGVFFPDPKGMTNPNLLVQCIGRGTRLCSDKSRCAVYLPCLIPGAHLSLQDPDASEDSLRKMGDKKKKRTWEGSFSIMALTFYEYLKQNNVSQEFPLMIKTIQSRKVLAKDTLQPESVTGSAMMPRPSEASRRFRPRTLLPNDA